MTALDQNSIEVQAAAVAVQALIEADKLLDEGQWKNALAEYEALYTAHSAEPNIFIGMGIAHYKLGNIDLAIRNFVDALFRRFEPTWLKFYLNALLTHQSPIPAVVTIAGCKATYPDLYQEIESTGLLNRANTACVDAGVFDKSATSTSAPIDDSEAALSAVQAVAELLKADENKEALVLAKEKIVRYPRSIGLLTNLGLAYKRAGLFEESLRTYLKVLLLRPEDQSACANLGNLFVERGEITTAIVFLEAAAISFPTSALIWSNLAAAYNHSGKMPVEAEFAARKSVEINNAGADILRNTYRLLASALSRQGRGKEALQSFKAGFDPDDRHSYNAPLLTMLMDDDHTAQDVTEAHKLYGKKLEELAADPTADTTDIVHRGGYPDCVSIGFVTADFRAHSVSYFALPLVEALALKDCSITVYFNQGNEDHVSERFKATGIRWRRVRGMPDENLVELIKNDGIDVLIDLSGHTGGNRLPVFMQKPAPLQLTWLGYPATTGLSAIDSRITDQYADPLDADDHYVEHSVRLGGHFCVYRPLIKSPEYIDSAEYMPQPPPALKNKFITFGSCNTLAKYSQTTVRMWSRVLQSVPESKLFIEAPGLNAIGLQRVLLRRFAEYGISPEQLILEPRDSGRQYLVYNQIDIALDPFPCGGGTTTFDLLWMGVPVVTLPSDRFAGRMGVSALTALGCSSWIAKSEDDYVEIARALASDVSALAAQRAIQRDQFIDSPLMAEDAFAIEFLRGIEEAWEKKF